MKKQFAVFGLGSFGWSVALTLESLGCDVLVVDKSYEKIQEISDMVSYAMKADVSDPEVMQTLGGRNLDGAVVAVSENLEASISATMQAKDLGVPFVVAKSMNSLHGRILDKIGADKIIYPEQAMGLRVARNLLSGGYLDVFELSAEFSMAEFSIPESWVGKSLIDLNVRERFHINIIGIKQGENVTVDLKPSEPLPDRCSIIAIGKNKDLNAEPAFMK